MRGVLVPFMVLHLVACSDGEPRRASREDAPAPLTSGEERARIDHPGQPSATMRSGPNVPVHLPQGFTVYPGAKVISNTVVDRGGKRQALLVFETVDPVERVIAFYRARAAAAGATITLDLGSEERASLGGSLANGGDFAIAARQRSGGTRVEFAVG